jgi:hypothetical protein
MPSGYDPGVATLIWGIVGSLAGVVGAVATIVLGVIPLARSRQKAAISRSGHGPVVELTLGQSAQAGARDVQVARHIENYLERMRPSMIPMQGSAVVGDVPQRARAYQPRRELMMRLGEAGPGAAIVRAVTGMRGVGKTQLAAAYARSRIEECWRLVAWINAESPSETLNGLAKIAATVGLESSRADLESLGEAVRHWLEAHGERCLVVFDKCPFTGSLSDAPTLPGV